MSKVRFAQALPSGQIFPPDFFFTDPPFFMRITAHLFDLGDPAPKLTALTMLYNSSNALKTCLSRCRTYAALESYFFERAGLF